MYRSQNVPETFVSLTKANLRSSVLTLENTLTKINQKVTDMERGGEETVNLPLPIRKSILWGHCLLLGDPLPSLDHKAPDQSRRVSKKRGKRNSLPGLAPLCAEWTHFLHRSSEGGTGFHTLPFQIPNYSISLSVFIVPADSHSFPAAFPWVRTLFAAVHIFRIITQYMLYMTYWRLNTPTICKKVIFQMASTEQEPRTTS